MFLTIPIPISTPICPSLLLDIMQMHIFFIFIKYKWTENPRKFSVYANDDMSRLRMKPQLCAHVMINQTFTLISDPWRITCSQPTPEEIPQQACFSFTTFYSGVWRMENCTRKPMPQNCTGLVNQSSEFWYNFIRQNIREQMWITRGTATNTTQEYQRCGAKPLPW